jgi:protein-tyrosine-phosphatase
MINRANLIFLMDCRNLVDYKLAFRSRATPVAYLGKLGSESPMIEDPHGSRVPEFRRTYNQIAEAVDTLPDLLSESVD